MTSPRSWRRLFAVPLAISLALGGSLLAAAPAYAAAPVISTPTDGSTVDSRTVTFTGTADAGAQVGLSSAGTPLAGPATADSETGAFTLTYTFPDTAETTQTLNITSLAAGVFESTPITITLPAPAPGEGPAPGTGFTLTAPNDNSFNSTYTVTFSGGAPAGAFVGVADENDNLFAEPVEVGESGTFSFDIVFPDTVGFRQTVVVGAYLGNDFLGEFPRTLNFAPAGNPSGPTDPAVTPFTVSGPDAVSFQFERIVTFSGTAPAGALVGIVDEEQRPLIAAPVLVGPSGVYSVDVDFSDSEGLIVPVAVGALYNGQVLGPITRVLVFAPTPAQLVAPVITTPTTESTVTGPTVTFTGTGTAGDTVYLGVTPAATPAESSALAPLIGAAIAQSVISGVPLNAATLQAAVGDAGVVGSAVVGPDGTFTVTLTLPDGLYTASAVSAYFTSQTDFGFSPPSNVVNFAVAGAAVAPSGTTPAVIKPVASTTTVKPAAKSTKRLAETGASAEGVLGFGVLLLLAGAGSLIVVRRLRSASAE